MQGGASDSGGPKGSRNGNYRRGHYTAEAIASRRWVRQQTPGEGVDYEDCVTSDRR